ncbi:ATP-binding protein [Mycolicibacterium smegmatis]|uniref:ATP-binding protein n=1 Tax=Mycolicibacterium smegmatis TaxID=1772 RepID=UPI002147A053|nr:ATP-binding protein [Mycolicibacterium smegmatis]UUR99524.1 ATP-binding protein [Mycolicibacterium smegmatis]UUS06079.1 ATP-binding protein [Mycolicibacterium smegmatis]UUS12634.1 ATP-binding protein [Mycolicibacterium smegmatis]UUS22463.1 ATP-binding protein [Mycolicibacterium smegmatis]UUS29008.1 ATP-binding protein [Mycolicibacterium smegmatis]
MSQVAVLDNGTGMNAAVLRMALQFGNGTHLDSREGIGRFGMGLPSASISQCKRVEVWSWQDGPENALYSYIDLKLIEKQEMTEVPAPVVRKIPKEWLDVASEIGAKGTLVVWSHLDRCMWRTAKTIIRNSEFVIARMYRKFLSDGRASIRLVAFTDTDGGNHSIDDYAVANDPGYLLTPSSTPEPFSETPMFQPDGDKWSVPVEIEYNGEKHTVFVRFSYAREVARTGHNPGSTPYGKHAARNVGVSLVRADRELDMDESLVISHDVTERWWGVEVDFPPSLDELFGVTNNKQSARNFSEVAANLDALTAEEDGITSTARRDLMREDEDPLGPLIDIVSLIDRRLSAMRKLLKVQRKGSSGKGRHRYDPDSAEAIATTITRERQQEGKHGVSDDGEGLPVEERTAVFKRELIDTGLSEQQADDIAAKTIEPGVKYAFAEADLEGRSFFTVRPVAGEILIKINVNHPAYHNLVEVLEADVDGELTVEQLRERLLRAHRGLKLLLMAWARYEDEQPSDARREEIQDIRTDWGRVAARFMRSE